MYKACNSLYSFSFAHHTDPARFKFTVCTSLRIWADQYYTYSVCIFVITWFSIITSAVESYRNRRRLADIAHFECDVEALRGGRFVTLPSPRLVPGDLVRLRPGPLPCDLVLLSGECVVDENMLTGERARACRGRRGRVGVLP